MMMLTMILLMLIAARLVKTHFTMRMTCLPHSYVDAEDQHNSSSTHQTLNQSQVIQVFDSWAGHLPPDDFDKWAAPYQKRVIAKIKEQRPDVPVIIYMAPDTHSSEGQLLERLAESGADVVLSALDARQPSPKPELEHI